MYIKIKRLIMSPSSGSVLFENPAIFVSGVKTTFKTNSIFVCGTPVDGKAIDWLLFVVSVSL